MEREISTNLMVADSGNTDWVGPADPVPRETVTNCTDERRANSLHTCWAPSRNNLASDGFEKFSICGYGVGL